MSAPMLQPQHHKRQEVCESRAPYREGRHAKAVKVYTVNQESCYLLVVGVPAVGGCQELVKLFAVYGAVEEYRVLDDYPAEEFTEAYLFKFKKIQSARFAKRKLDDYSFFGGVLHVCYAPEYESVEETRFKLQDRRRVIAAKIRQHATNTENTSEMEATNASVPHIAMDTPSTSQPSSETNSRSEEQLHEQDHSRPHTELEQAPQVHADNYVMNSQWEDNSHIQFMNLELPPPPLNMAPPRHRQPPVRPSNYGYAWVASSHSTLPAQFNGQTDMDRNPESTGRFCQEDLTKPIYSKYLNSDDSPKAPPKPEMFDKEKTKTVNGLVVKEYKKPGIVPKFVPRQAVKKTCESEKKNCKSRPETDGVNKELRANAFTLGQSQGPTMPSKDDQKVKVHPAAEKAVNQTVKDIRKRISKFISEKIPPPKKSRPASGKEEKT